MIQKVFIGIPLGENIAQEIRKNLSPLEKFERNFYWIPEASWHITLSFVGNVDATKIHKIQKILGEYVTEQRYFNIYFDGVMLWPPKQQSRKIVLTMVKNRNLMDFHYGLKNALKGFLQKTEFDRKFYPHVTIINLRRGPLDNEMKSKVEDIEFKKRFEVSEICMMETLKVSKPPAKYQVLSESKMIVDDKFQGETGEEETD